MTTDALRRLQALHGQPRPASAFGALAQVQVDLQTVIEAVLELADENTPPASQNGPQEARSADSGTGGPPEPENGAQGRIGWLRLRSSHEHRWWVREVPGGWTDPDPASGDYPAWSAVDFPDAEFGPIRVLADDEVAVKREAVAEAEAYRDRVEALFAGGPDTPCRTLWRAVEGIAGEWHEVECVEVPMGDLRAALEEKP